MPISNVVDVPIRADLAATSMPSSAFNTDAYLSLGSQYVYRGVALRNSGPAFSGELALSQRLGWFVDIWIGQVDVGYYDVRHDDYAEKKIAQEWQVDLNAGYGAEWGRNWQWSLSRAWIRGIDTPLPAPQNYQEWRADIFYRENVSMQLAYAENYRQLGWSSWNAEIKTLRSLTPTINGELGVGHSHGAGASDNNYNYSWLAMQGDWVKTEWNLRWTHSTDGARLVLDKDRAGSRVELTLSWRLPILR